MDLIEIGQYKESDHAVLARGTGYGTNIFFPKVAKSVGRKSSGHQLGPERIGPVVLAVFTKRGYENRTIYRRCRGINSVPVKTIRTGAGLPGGTILGNIIGAYLAVQRPDLVRAYIAIGQVVDMERGELISYQFTLDEARRLNNKKAIQQLEKIGPPPYAKLSDGGVQRSWLSKFHGAAYEGTLEGTILKNISIRDLRPFNLLRFVAGAMFSLSALEDEQNKVKIIRDVPELKVPVYFCCGRRDYNVPFELVVEYCEKLKAPQKRIIWFDHSGHLPNIEEADLFCDFCKSLI